MKNEKLTGFVWVIGNDLSVCEAKVIDNTTWGEGYVTVELEDGRKMIADSDRCFKDQLAADRAAKSDKIAKAIVD